jgi:hypothetical protein
MRYSYSATPQIALIKNTKRKKNTAKQKRGR